MNYVLEMIKLNEEGIRCFFIELFDIFGGFGVG